MNDQMLNRARVGNGKKGFSLEKKGLFSGYIVERGGYTLYMDGGTQVIYICIYIFSIFLQQHDLNDVLSFTRTTSFMVMMLICYHHP